LICKTNPGLAKFTPEGKVFEKKVARVNREVFKKGYMSKTTNQFQLGKKGAKQWVCEDVLILGGSPFQFSVVAQSRMTVIEISKADMQTKLPHSF